MPGGAKVVVDDVVTTANLIAEGIQNIRTIREAINDGHTYIEYKHRAIKDDLISLCEEMTKSLQAIAGASAIITNFRFSVAGSEMEKDASRFNNHLVKHKLLAKNVDKRLDKLRGSCFRIREDESSLINEATLWHIKLSELIGLRSEERERDLIKALDNIFEADTNFLLGVRDMQRIISEALDAVQMELGPPGMMFPENVPKAAEVLGNYAQLFAKIESEAEFEAWCLKELVDELKN
jgi:hypothetical protein